MWGPIKIIKDFVNQRLGGPTRPGYVLVIICEFSRLVILHALEGLSKQNLLDALETIFFRYGRISKMRTDWGTNFTSARQELAGTGDEIASDGDLIEFSRQMKSRGTEIELKAPHMPWASAGGAESMNKNIFKCMDEVKQSYTAFGFVRFLEKCQFLINERPISLSNTLEILCPNDVSSVHTRIKNVNTLDEFLQKADENVRLFAEKWMDLYMSSLYSQKKWFTSSKVKVGSLLHILDTKNSFNYPSLGILRRIEEGTVDEVDRYFMVEHKTRTGQTRTLRRPAQQLSLVLEKSEMGEESEEDEDSGPDDDDQDGHGLAGDLTDVQDDVPDFVGNEVENYNQENDDDSDSAVMQEHENVGGQHQEEEEDESLWGDNETSSKEQNRGKPWRFSLGEEDEDVGEVENNTVQNIVNIETDQESQSSKSDSDGDNVEEDLGPGPFSMVKDNIQTQPALKVIVPEAPSKIVDKKKKPKRKMKAKRK